MKKRIASAVIVVICIVCLATIVWTEYNRYEAKSSVVELELGKQLSKDCGKYIYANTDALKETELDLSKVDFSKPGEYAVTAKYKKKTAKFTVKIQDTTAPVIKLKKEEYKAVIGKTVKASDVIEDVKDAAEIKEISFGKHEIGLDKENENILERTGFKLDKIGKAKIKITAEDVNGNIGKVTLQVKVVEDYLAHVSGFKDFTVEQGSSIDWMQGINQDEKILEVKADASQVDLEKPGDYTLTYKITGDDKETVVEKSVKVTVVSPADAQALANAGNTVQTTNGVKAAVQPKSNYSGNASGGGSRSNGNSYSGGYSSGGYSGSSSSGSSSSGGSSSGGSTGSSSGSSSWQPGQSWQGTQTDQGYIGGGSEDSNGNTYESGTWNPWG